MRQIVLWFLVVMVMSSCREDAHKSPRSPVATFYLIRHAEKDRTELKDPDPPLTQKGLLRAKNWAQYFDSIPLDHIYSTNYVRTRITAAPVSQQKDLPVIHYDPATFYRSDLIQEHIGHHVLIVGHSNTTPMLVNQLLGENRFGQMDDNDNSSLFIVYANKDHKMVEVREVVPQ